MLQEVTGKQYCDLRISQLEETLMLQDIITTGMVRNFIMFRVEATIKPENLLFVLRLSCYLFFF